jgi:hypothetical protein
MAKNKALIGIGAGIGLLGLILLVTGRAEGGEGGDGGNGGGQMPPTYGPLTLDIVSWPPAPGWRCAVVGCALSNPNDVAISPIVALRLHYSVYIPGYGDYEKDYQRNPVSLNIPAGGDAEYYYDGREDDNAVLFGSGEGKSWQLWLEDNLGGMSEIAEFTS